MIRGGQDGGLPEVYTADAGGGAAVRRTYRGDPRTRVTRWTDDGEVLRRRRGADPSGAAWVQERLGSSAAAAAASSSPASPVALARAAGSSSRDRTGQTASA